VRLNLDWTSPNGVGTRESTLATRVIVDFMSKMLQMSFVQLSTLGDVVNAIISSASNLSQGPAL